MRRSGLRGLALVAILGVSAGACGGDDDAVAPTSDVASTSPGGSSGPTTSGQGATTTDGGAGAADPEAVLRIGANLVPGQAMPLDPRLFDSADHGLFMYQLYAPLVRYDPATGEYSPYLAESYEVEDPRTVTVVLRDDATFHDGRPVRAEDAQATIEAMKTNLEAGAARLNPGIGLVEEVEVVDDRTFTVHLGDDGLATLFELLIGPEFMIVPADAGASQATAPVGTGPFSFVSLVDGERIVLEKYDGFFAADEVKLGGLEFVNLAEGTTQLNALLGGDIDFAHKIDLAGYQAVENQGGSTAFAFRDPTQLEFFIGCKADGHFYDDLRVRQALAYATDREAFNEAIFGGHGEPTAQWWPAGHPYHDPALEDIYPYDPQRATELLEEAGVAGQSQGVYVNSEIRTDMALVLDHQWSAAGLSLEPVPTDDVLADFLRPSAEDPDSLQHDAMMLGNSRAGLQKLSRNFLPGAANNICKYDDPRVTELIEALFGLAPDDPEAIAKWHQVQRILVEDAVVDMLVIRPNFMGWSDEIGGVDPASFQSTTSGAIDFSRMYVPA